MHRPLTNSVYWIQECNTSNVFGDGSDETIPDWGAPNSTVHNSNSAFLIVDEQTLLFDTLSRAAEETIIAELGDILGDRELDYLVPSHPETPHAGNTSRICREYPDATILAPDLGSNHDLYYLENARRVNEGDVVELGEHEFEFVEAYFLDHGMSLWAYERASDLLLTVDWLGFPHLEDRCLTCVDELDGDVTESQLHVFHGRVFSWYEFADLDKVNATIDYLSTVYGNTTIAPAHGLVIREDASRYMDTMRSVVEDIRERGRINTGTIW